MILEWDGMGWNGIICGIGKRAGLLRDISIALSLREEI